MPNASFTEIITTTLQRYSGRIKDNITNHNALLRRLDSKGGMSPAPGGRTIVEELDYAENGTVAWYSGYDVISTNTSQVLTAAEFQWKQLAGTIKFNGLESDVQNTSAEAVTNLVSARVRNLDRSLRNTMATGLYAVGTGSGGKEMGGLQLIVADTVTSGIVGGIDRNSDTWWRNQSIDASADLNLTLDKTNINEAMNEMWLRLQRGADKPDLIVADSVMFRLYWASLQTIQRITSADMATGGFGALKFVSADVVYDDQCPASHMYFLNTDYLAVRYASKRNFVALDDRAPADVAGGTVDALVRPVVWAGNMTCSNCSLQGTLRP